MNFIFEILIILILVIFQSLFGVGLLLFGTPIFLLLGNNFENTLTLILPVSIMISLLQLTYSRKNHDIKILEFNLYCLPFLIIFLLLNLFFGSLIDIKLYVSILLIVSSLIGCIHGATNMGGAFLSIFSSLVNNENRLNTRYYIAYGYFIMGIIQYITILLIGKTSIDFSKLIYISFPIIVFYPLQNVFSKMNDKFFITIINYVALSFGFIALLMSIS